jgi:hypothetical protein
LLINADEFSVKALDLNFLIGGICAGRSEVVKRSEVENEEKNFTSFHFFTTT